MSADPANPKDIIGSTKLPLHLWPPAATALGSLGLFEGELKYGRTNWRASGVRASIYYAALKRHIDAWWEGEAVDPTSEVPHLGHALACLAIIIDAEMCGKLVDDRQYPVAKYRELIDALTPMVPRLQKLYADRNPKHYTRLDDVNQK